MATVGPIVQGSPLGWAPLATAPPPRPHPWRLRAGIIGGVVVILVALAVVASFFVTVDYVSFAPGHAIPVNDLIKVPPDKANPPQGQILLVTVSGSGRRLRAADYYQAKYFEDHVDLIPAKAVFGSSTPAQYQQAVQGQMADSKQAAAIAALRRLGMSVAVHGTGAVVAQTTQGAAADGRLFPGDVITSVDGHPVATLDDVRPLIRAHHPEDPISITIEHDGFAPRTVNVAVGSCPTELFTATPPGCAQGDAFLGVSFSGTRALSFDLPFPVTIESGLIGGPSAGLAFTLGLIDALTPGELTGDNIVAATGEIFADGTVGPIGEANLKAVAVTRAGAKLFLVPKDGDGSEERLAKANVGPGVKVVAVANLDEALAALKDFGGDLSGVPADPAAPPAQK